MNIEVDGEFLNLTSQTLVSLLSPNKEIITQAEQQLNILKTRKDYAFVLIYIMLNESNEFGIRQLAGVLFKQYVEVHWTQNTDKFQEPEVDPEVKQKVKQLLPLGISDQSSKVRTQVAVAVSLIASWDWPESWPNLFDILLSALNGVPVGKPNPTNQIDLNTVHGALETLNNIVPDISDLQMPQVAPAVIPQIYKIFIDPENYSIMLRKRAIEIFSAIIDVISEMAEYDPSAGKKYLFPYLPDFTLAMTKVLSLSPQESPNLVDYGLKKEIIKVFGVLFRCFPKRLSTIINDVLAQVWACLVSSSDVYMNKVVNADTNEAESFGNKNDSPDFEDEKTSFENLIYQLFEFILILKDKKKYKPVLKKAMDELNYYAILYMQMTDEQVETWTSNPEQYVQDEDDESYSYSVRISAQELIENLAMDFKKETASGISKTIERQMELAQKLRAANNNSWWKIHEACLLAVSSIKTVLQDLQTANLLEFNLNAFVNQFVLACLHESNFPFLVGRALFTASRFPKLLSPETLETLIKATGSALHESQNPIIRVSAMKSIYCFVDELTNENQQHLLIPHLPQITEGLIQMITQNANNQIGTLTLETLVSVLGVDEKFVETIESKVSPLAIALFIKNTNDPLVNSIVTDTLKTLINNPYTYSKIEQRLMPTLVSIINTIMNPKPDAGDQKELANLLSSTLDLITIFVRASNHIPLSDLTMNAFMPVINLCLKSDDTVIIQNGGECLRAYVSKSPDQIIALNDDKGISALNYIVLVINHMLDPKTSENSCTYVGKFITTLIRRMAHVLGDNLDAILKSVLSRIQSSNSTLVQQSLILVFAHLFHTKMDAVLTFLTTLTDANGKPVLEFFMTEWVGKQSSFCGSYECKVSILALAKILEFALTTEDARFKNILVKGDRIINPVEGIKTRSKTKNEGEMFTQIPLLVKIYKLIINELHSLLEEKADEEEDYEEEEEGEGDEDEEDDENDPEKDGIDVDENNAESEAIDACLNKYDIFDDAFDNEDYDEHDPEALEDPLIKIDLLEYLKGYLNTLSQHPYYKLFCEHHNNLEKQVLKEAGVTNV